MVGETIGMHGEAEGIPRHRRDAVVHEDEGGRGAPQGHGTVTSSPSHGGPEGARRRRRRHPAPGGRAQSDGLLLVVMIMRPPSARAATSIGAIRSGMVEAGPAS